MTKEQIMEVIAKVISENKIALVGTNAKRGYPNIKALQLMENEDLKVLYFSTRSESLKVKQMKRNKKGCVYFYDKEKYIGVMMEGIFKVENNTKFGVSKIYEIDPHDPYDFCTIKFTVKTITFYMNYQTARFTI